MEHIDMTKEEEPMNSAEAVLRAFEGTLEAIKIITERANNKEEVIEAIERIQGKIKEATPTTK